MLNAIPTAYRAAGTANDIEALSGYPHFFRIFAARFYFLVSFVEACSRYIVHHKLL